MGQLKHRQNIIVSNFSPSGKPFNFFENVGN